MLTYTTEVSDDEPGVSWRRKGSKTAVCHTCEDRREVKVAPWNFPGQNTGMGSHSLLQGMFPTQGSNPGLPHCRRIFYQLSHKGSPLFCNFKIHISAKHSNYFVNLRKKNLSVQVKVSILHQQLSWILEHSSGLSNNFLIDYSLLLFRL